MSKQDSADTSSKLAEIARDYYVTGASQSKIAQDRHMQQSTVSQMLQEARETGVVWFDIDPDFGDRGTEQGQKSMRLRDAFDLKHAFVVEIDDSGGSKTLDPRGNVLHTIIANTVASSRLRNWIQAQNHVVVAGGRAPMRAARMIRRGSPSDREVRVSPLSGRIWTGSWQEDGSEILERPLDADDVARMLASAFEHQPGTRFSQIGLALYQDEQQIEQVVARECVFCRGGGWNTSWGIKRPDKALVGVGVVDRDSGHRMPQLMKRVEKTQAREPQQETAMEWAAREFRRAMDFAREHGLPKFGDLANRLFPCLFLPSEIAHETGKLSQFDASYRGLAKLLFSLNNRAVVMEWSHLRKIPSVWAIAGGELKLHALWTLLIAGRFDRRPSKGNQGNKNQSLIKELATDVQIADHLLDELAKFENLPNEIRDWYERMTGEIFNRPS